MIYRFWEWYDSLLARDRGLRFFVFLILIAPFLLSMSFPRHSGPILVGLGWVCLVIVTRVYYTVRKQMDKEALEEHGTRHTRE